VIGGTFVIGSGWINVSEPPAFAVRGEIEAVFLWFALIHQLAIQGSGSETETIFIA
jgi:hypothetical protein